MPQTINTNIASLNAQRNLNMSQASLATSMQRLSSGLRVNSAKDDAAGMAIAERMHAQVRGLNVAGRNANDGISLAQTAEGALGKVGDMLQRIRELAVQSANATNSNSDRAALQAEAVQLRDEIDRVATQTSFNGLPLLDGSFTAQQFQVGANQGETIDINAITNAQVASLGTWTSVATPAVAGSYATNQLSSLNFSTAGSALVGGYNTSTVVPGGSGANVNFTVGGVGAGNFTVGATPVSLTADYSGDANAANMASAIGTQLGAGYTVTSSGWAITITDNATATAVAITGSNGVATTAGLANSTGTAGSPAVVTSNLSFDVDGTTVNLTADFTGNQAGMVSAIQTAVGAGYVVAAAGSAGFSITSATAGATPATVVNNFSTSSITGASGGTAVAAADPIPGGGQTGFAALDISTVAGANNAILAMDGALNDVNSARGTLGAVQSRFESVITNIMITAENLSAARGRIVDADFAAETANLSRAQILQQAGTAMVAQANALPQQVLQLLK